MEELRTILAFEIFWQWLALHHNCIVRAGSAEAWLYDQDDLHWHLYEDPDGRLGLQLMRGKQVLAEIAIPASEITSVEVLPSQETDGHYDFHLLGGDEEPMQVLTQLVLAHGYDEEPSTSSTH